MTDGKTRQVRVLHFVAQATKRRKIVHEPAIHQFHCPPSEKRGSRPSSPFSSTTIQIDLFPAHKDLQMQPINVLFGPSSYWHVYSLEDSPERIRFPHGGRLYLGKAAKLASDSDDHQLSEALMVSGRGLLGDLILDVSYKQNKETEVVNSESAEMIRRVLECSSCAPMNPTDYDNVAAWKAFREAASRRRHSIWKRLFGELTLRLPTMPSWDPQSTGVKYTLNAPQNFTPKSAEVCLLGPIKCLIFIILLWIGIR